jgi:hypothetical protein
MEAADFFHLRANLRQGTGRQGHGAVFLAFAVMNSKKHGIQIEAMDAKVDTFCQPQAAAVEEQNYKAVGRLKSS